MKIVITGGIGCGKSYVASLIKSEYLSHYELYDYDKVVHTLYDNPTIQSALYLAFGTWDRRELSKHVFNDKKAMNKLKKIFSQPLIDSLSVVNSQPNVIIDIPVWYEYRKDIPITADYVVCAACKDDVQIDRVVKRDGRTPHQVSQIIKSQVSQEHKKHLSDFIIYTDLTVDLRTQLDKMFHVMKITTDKSQSSPQISQVV